MRWLLLFPLLWYLQPARYHVVFSSGYPYHVSKNKDTIQRGDIVFPSDSIRFRNKEGILRLVGSKGTLVLGAERNSSGKRGSEFWTIIQNELIPSVQIKPMRGRNGNILTQLDLKVFLESLEKDSIAILVTDSVALPLHLNVVENINHQFFYIKNLNYQGSDARRIAQKKMGQSLLLLPDFSLTDMDSKGHGYLRVNSATFFLYDEEKELSWPLGRISMNFTPRKELIKELRVVKAVRCTNDIQCKEELKNYIYQYYGFLSETSFNDLYKAL